ncbi:MAG: hypothetical protein WB699_18720 [Bacteroidota bacterium]
MFSPVGSRKAFLMVLFVLLCTSAASSCPVCFGAKDAPVNQASVQAIEILLGCTGVVAAGIGGFATRIFFRLKKHRQTK